MRAARADASEQTVEPAGGYLNSRSEELVPAAPQLKIAELPPRNRLQRRLEIADTLLHETSTLARDKAFTDQSNLLRSLNLSEGIDFYNEVERFETGLIRLALDQTSGHQARAAKLLNIKPTTLNSKIKLYGIEY